MPPVTLAAERFAGVMGREPAGVWSAPGRVNLIGEHTDYNDGLALPVALSLSTTAAAAPRTDDRVRAHSIQLGETVEVDLREVGRGRPAGWTAYVAGVVWALREEGYAVPGLDVVVDGRVPLGSGLSSSASLTCAVAAAASELAGLDLLESAEGRSVLARAAVRAENDVAGAPTGGLDQAAALHCTAGHALLLDCRDVEMEQVPFDPPGLGTALLVMDTRVSHDLADGQYGDRRAACQEASARLGVGSLRDVADEVGGAEDALARRLDGLGDETLRRRARHVVTEIERVRACVAALRTGDVDEVGRLFDASHASLRDDYEVSSRELDLAVETARSAGALGARMTGGGFGGSAIALVPVDAMGDVTLAVTSAFAAAGLTRPHCFTVEPSDGASRVTSPT